tara:strand:+ start:58 stop:483 length:426 start_codon:yes stop_codon:yes gene_type:complete
MVLLQLLAAQLLANCLWLQAAVAAAETMVVEEVLVVSWYLTFLLVLEIIRLKLEMVDLAPEQIHHTRNRDTQEMTVYLVTFVLLVVVLEHTQIHPTGMVLTEDQVAELLEEVEVEHHPRDMDLQTNIQYIHQLLVPYEINL